MTGYPEDPNAKLFVEDDADWWMNACLSEPRDRHTAMMVYADGYRRAARVLHDHVAEEGRDQDFLIFPLAYNWRHFLELQLKCIIALGREIVGGDFGFPNDHRLAALWPEARKHLEPLGDPTCDTMLAVDAIIDQMAKFDPRGIAFRYAFDRDLDPSIANAPARISIRNLHERMEEVATMLEGCRTMMSEYLSELISNMEREYDPREY